MDLKNINLEDIIKRDLYDKFGESINNIKNKIGTNLSDCDKKKLIKKIAYLILLFQTDKLYKNITEVSGIESYFELFGLSDTKSKFINKISSKGMNILSIALLIYAHLEN